MFAWRGIRTVSSIRWRKWCTAPIPSFVRSFAISGKKRNFITSEAVEMGQLTPALQQYFKLKEQYKGCCFLAQLGIEYVLFFRIGDFYEFFFNDAITMSQVLGIALTTRGKYKGLCLIAGSMCRPRYSALWNPLLRSRQLLEKSDSKRSQSGNLRTNRGLLHTTSQPADSFRGQITRQAKKSCIGTFGGSPDLCRHAGRRRLPQSSPKQLSLRVVFHSRQCSLRFFGYRHQHWRIRGPQR